MTRSQEALDRPASRRQVLALLGGSIPVTVAGCSSRSGKIEYGNRSTVNDLPTPEEDNVSNASEAIAAKAYAQLDGDNYAIPLQGLELREHDIVVRDSYKGVVIQGVVANTRRQQLEVIEVRARIYDTDGNQLGRYLDSTQDLAAGSTWSFDIIVLEDPSDIGSYDIAVVGSVG